MMRTLMSLFVFMLTGTAASLFLAFYTANHSGDSLWHTITVVLIYGIARVSKQIEDVLENDH